MTFTDTDIYYIDSDGKVQTPTAAVSALTESSTTLTSGWYLARDQIDISSRVSVSGDVHLIIKDGAVLNIPKGITVEGDNVLNIYGQANHSGKLTVSDPSYLEAGIGGTDNKGCGTVVINDGTIDVKGGLYEDNSDTVTWSPATTPAAKETVYTGQAVVTEGTANGGTMQYVLSKDNQTAPTTGWSTSVPTATGAGTYYVWYKVDGDDNHRDTNPTYIPVTVRSKSSSSYTPTTYTVTFKVVNGSWDFKVIKVSNYAFDGCENLKWIVIHRNIRVIGEDAFNGTAALTKMNIKGYGIVSGKVTDAFEGAGKNGRLTVKVPKNKVNEYSELFTGEGGLNGNVKAA